MEFIDHDGSTISDWMVGFEDHGSYICCVVCGAVVGKKPELTSRHRGWHAKLEAQGGS